MTLKDRIGILLKERNLTNDDLIRLSGINRGTYYNQFFKNDDIKLSYLLKFSEILKISVAELIGEKPISQSKSSTDDKLDEIIKNQTKILNLLQKKSELTY